MSHKEIIDRVGQMGFDLQHHFLLEQWVILYYSFVILSCKLANLTIIFAYGCHIASTA